MSINFLFKFELNVDSFGSGSRRGVDDSEVVYVIVLVWSSPANYYFYMKMFFFGIHIDTKIYSTLKSFASIVIECNMHIKVFTEMNIKDPNKAYC